MLIGRQSELALLAERLAEGRPVGVLGEAGVGKTTLVRVAAERAGVRLVEAGALATLSWLPYLPLRRAFGRELDGDSAYVAATVESELEGAVLFLDDLQWADARTAAVVPLLAGRVALMAAVRRGDPGTAAALEAAALAGVELLPLEPLEADDATALARALHPGLSDLATRRLVERSGGNPFLLEQLAVTGEATESLRLGVAARLRALTPAGRDAIAILSLLGRPASPRLLGPGANEIVAAGLATATGDVGEVGVRHALLAETTIETLTEEQRRRLHSRIASALDDLGEAARHHAAAGERSLAHEKALSAAERTTTRGERVVHLAVAAANADGVEAEQLRVDAADALLEAGEPAHALELIAELQPLDVDRAAKAALLRSRAHFGLVRLEDSQRELDAAVATGTDDAVVRVRIAMQRAALAARAFDYRTALDRTEEALRMADSVAVGPGELAELHARLGSARRNLGLPGAREAQEHAVALAREAGATELEFTATTFLTFGLLLDGEAAEAARIAGEAAERARSLRLLAWERDLRAHHTGFMWHLAEPAVAAAEAEAVLSEAVSPDLREFLEFYWWQAMADLGRGDLVRELAEARVANAPADNDGVGDALWALGDIELAAGRADVAERHATSYLERFGRASTFVGVLRAWAQFDQEHVPTPVPPSRYSRYRLLEAGPVEVDAIIDLARGNAGDAADRFERAAALWGGRHVRGTVRCRWAAAESLRRAGNPDASRTRLLLVETEAERRQLNVLLRKIRRSLRLIGVKRAAERSVAGVLTGREREVLELVAAGLTNREIARRLGLGQPTVVRLIRTAQQKLGATSRTQAAALAARQ